MTERTRRRHYIAVLIQANLWRRDSNVPAAKRMPNPVEFGKAIDYAVSELKKGLHSKEPASEDLKDAAMQYAKYTAAPPSDVAYHFEAGARWQKEKTIDKAVEWLYQKQISVPNIDEFINDFKRYVED